MQGGATVLSIMKLSNTIQNRNLSFRTLRIMMHSKMMPSIMMLSKMTLSIMMLSKITIDIMMLSIMMLSRMTLSMMTLIKMIFNKMTLSIMILGMSKEYTTLSIMTLSLLTLDTGCCYAESHISLRFMLSVGTPVRELKIRSKIKDRNM